VDVDAIRAGLLDHPSHDRPAAGYVPPAVPDGLSCQRAPRRAARRSSTSVPGAAVTAANEPQRQLTQGDQVVGHISTVQQEHCLVRVAGGLAAAQVAGPGALWQCARMVEWVRR